MSEETCGCPNPDIHSRQNYASGSKGMQSGSAWCRNCEVAWTWSVDLMKWVRRGQPQITDTQRLESLLDIMKLHVVALDQTVYGKFRLIIGGKSYSGASTPKAAIDVAIKERNERNKETSSGPEAFVETKVENVLPP